MNVERAKKVPNPAPLARGVFYTFPAARGPTSGNDIFHHRFQVGDRGLHAIELNVLFLGYLNSMPLAKFHDDIQKVHAVQFDLVTEAHFIFQVRQIFIRRDGPEDIEYFLFNLGVGHADGSPALYLLDNDYGIDPQHSKRIAEDGADRLYLAWLVEDQAGQLALRIETVHVDCRVTNTIVK